MLALFKHFVANNELFKSKEKYICDCEGSFTIQAEKIFLSIYVKIKCYQCIQFAMYHLRLRDLLFQRDLSELYRSRFYLMKKKKKSVYFAVQG